MKITKKEMIATINKDLTEIFKGNDEIVDTISTYLDSWYAEVKVKTKKDRQKNIRALEFIKSEIPHIWTSKEEKQLAKLKEEEENV